MKTQWTLILGLLFAIIIAVFATVNIDKVPVNYIFGEAQWPLVLVILGSALLGALISACFSMIRIFTQSRQLSQVKKQLHERETIVVAKDMEIARLNDELAKQPTTIPTLDKER